MGACSSLSSAPTRCARACDLVLPGGGRRGYSVWARKGDWASAGQKEM